MKRELLSRLESMILLFRRNHKFPPIFVVGCPRAGTTIISQYLLANYKFSYFSNIDRQHAKHPILSALWHRSARKFQPRFRNQYGHIKGKHAPGDGWQIFHRWFSYYYNPNKTQPSIHQLKTTIAYYEMIYNWPFFVKNNANSLRILELATLFPDAFIIFIHRSIYENVNSILNGKKENNIPDEKIWAAGPDKILSSDIPAHPIANAVYQYLFVNKFIRLSIKKFSLKKVLNIDFSTFKGNPDQFLNKFTSSYHGPLHRRRFVNADKRGNQREVLNNPVQIPEALKNKIDQYRLKYEPEVDILVAKLLLDFNFPCSISKN